LKKLPAREGAAAGQRQAPPQVTAAENPSRLPQASAPLEARAVRRIAPGGREALGARYDQGLAGRAGSSNRNRNRPAF